MATVDVRPAKLNYKITRGDDFADQVTIKENGVAVDVSTHERFRHGCRDDDD
jgi:hypothetical protein